MIELSPTTGFMLYLGATFVFLLGLWSYQHYLSRKKKILTTKQELFVCEYCQFAYLAELDRKVTQCPQCHSFNKSNVYNPKNDKER